LSDPAMVQYARQGLEELLDDGVDLLFCNEQEALMFTNTDKLDDAIQILKQKNQHIVITKGAQGAVIIEPAQQLNVAGRVVTAVDTNGAGDAFAGAFLYALNAGLSLETAAQLAILISSEVVAQFGPRLSVARYAELFEQFKNTQQECA
ncbi:MAG: PfkB family carbohydrate kinase, partial [Acinetobacter sp.]